MQRAYTTTYYIEMLFRNHSARSVSCRRSSLRLAQINFRVVEIVFGVADNHFAVGIGQLATLLSWDAGPQRTWGNDGVFRDDRARRDDRALADTGVVQDHDADADEAGIFNNAAVDGGVVANRDPIADDDRIAMAHSVEHGAVLHVGVGTDGNGVDVAAHDGVHPDAGMLTQGYVADDLGRWIDVTGLGDDREFALIGTNHKPVQNFPFMATHISSRFV